MPVEDVPAASLPDVEAPDDVDDELFMSVLAGAGAVAVASGVVVALGMVAPLDMPVLGIVVLDDDAVPLSVMPVVEVPEVVTGVGVSVARLQPVRASENVAAARAIFAVFDVMIMRVSFE